MHPNTSLSNVVDTMSEINWENGNFTVGGKEYVFPLCGQKDIDYSKGWISFEDDDGLHYGWKCTQNDKKVQVIFNVKQKSFSCSVTFLSFNMKISWEQRI